ncbi:hypothetical protein C4568_04945 [Candidatus Parcubacteria bacterium]|nr:MAG: hypothetical protein C4568_04945 [Candidatus Parcubacteria bacterium]
MVAKETTLNELGETLAYVVEHMATKDDIANMATKDDIAVIRAEMATKADIAGIMEELADIKLRLKTIEPLVEDHAGHSKEIDHALERISAIEKHLGFKPKAA